jgi:uncharacterized protein (DUF2141 family)
MDGRFDVWPRVAVALAAPLLLAANPPASDLHVELENLRNHKGTVRVCLTRVPKHFPDCTDDPAALNQSISASGDAVVFRNIAAGRYAVAIVHDENGNGELDTMLGIPREGFGFSRNPKIGFGPPKFAAAGFDVGPGTTHQVVRVRYLL